MRLHRDMETNEAETAHPWPSAPSGGPEGKISHCQSMPRMGRRSRKSMDTGPRLDANGSDGRAEKQIRPEKTNRKTDTRSTLMGTNPDETE